jgi:hypothetical protein
MHYEAAAHVIASRPGLLLPAYEAALRGLAGGDSCGVDNAAEFAAAAATTFHEACVN